MVHLKNQLRQLLELHVPISNDDWELIGSMIDLIEVDKGHVLTNAKSIEDNLYFVCSGVARLFYEKEERDITINFGFPNGFISSYSSFLSQTKSEFILQTLTPMVLIQISKANLEAIYTQTSCGQQLGRLFAEQFFIYLSQRESDFMLKTPTERYLALFDQQARLIQEIPLKYLASYIGITPQALSRIRAKIS